jgi:hypothetical protein
MKMPVCWLTKVPPYYPQCFACKQPLPELIKNGGRFEFLTASKRKKAHEKKNCWCPLKRAWCLRKGAWHPLKRAWCRATLLCFRFNTINWVGGLPSFLVGSKIQNPGAHTWQVVQFLKLKAWHYLFSQLFSVNMLLTVEESSV